MREGQDPGLAELRRFATQLLWICGTVETAGWICVVLAFTGVVRGPLAPVVIVGGFALASAGLFGAIWTAIRLARLK